MPDTVVKMPQLGESVAEGTIGRWLKQPGERVERDEPLVEIQTDKVNAEVPSPVAGVLREILLPEGTTAAVKTDMAIIADEADAPAAQSSPEAPPSEMPVDEAQPAAQGPEGTTTERTPAESSAAEPARLGFTYDRSPGGGVVGHRDPKVVTGVPHAHRVVHPPTPVHLRDLGSPEVGADAVRPLQRSAHAAPRHEVVGAQHLEGAAVDDPTRSDRDVTIGGGHDEGIGEVCVVHGVSIGHGHAGKCCHRACRLAR
jgi:pyruvate/2-oxoglutarate dehydrogenase complex dihydrolipoamide acyltransferase (E2) component